LHYFVFLESWLPEEAILEGRNASYQGWAYDKWIQTTPGNELDLDVIEASVLEDAKLFDLREVAYDPHQALQMAQHLTNHGLLMVEMRPTVANFNAPMKELEAAHASGRLHVQANPVLRWMASNVVAHRNAKDEVYPRKEQDANKIDGIVASLMAINRVMATAENTPYTDGEGFKSL
jgi:phage terminase large subunit-like protein